MNLYKSVCNFKDEMKIIHFPPKNNLSLSSIFALPLHSPIRIIFSLVERNYYDVFCTNFPHIRKFIKTYKVPNFSLLTPGPLDPNTEVVVGVSPCYLDYVRSKLPASIGVAAQNCYKADKGAFTGEICPAMIKESALNAF